MTLLIVSSGVHKNALMMTDPVFFCVLKGPLIRSHIDDPLSGTTFAVGFSLSHSAGI